MTWKDGEIKGVTIRRILRHEDPRGWLAEIYRQDEIDAGVMPVMTYVSVTRPGIARGPHEHTEQTDMFAFIGPGNFKLLLWDPRPDSPTRGNRFAVIAGQDNPVVVTVPPGVVHGYRNISSQDGWVVNCPNRLFAGRHRKHPVDEIRHEDRKDSDFPMED